MKQFSIRQLLAATAMVGIVLAIVRRPLLWLIQKGDTSSGCIGNFLDSFRHLAWLAGFDVKYADGSLNYPALGRFGENTFPEDVASGVGFILSAVLHLGLAFGIFELFRTLWRWACKEPKQHDSFAVLRGKIEP